MSRAHRALFSFHQAHVTLGKPELESLRRLRDINVARLHQGLERIGRASFVSSCSQGGYAMSTLTQRDDDQQDLDLAVIFDASHLPNRPVDARAVVHEAVLAAAPEGFSRPPERRTNAVTVWYSGGYHIDFAVYRSTGRTVEHAGPAWELADPAATVAWFIKENKRHSPAWSRGSLVADAQLRRIVRYMKYLRHGDDEEYPGGYIITALACRNYQPSADGDDIALAATLARAANEIAGAKDLPDPIVRGRSLLPRQKDVERMRRYGALLNGVLEPLRPLFGVSRHRVDAIDAWERALGVELPVPPPR